jgi:hypothetical protein
MLNRILEHPDLEENFHWLIKRQVILLFTNPTRPSGHFPKSQCAISDINPPFWAQKRWNRSNPIDMMYTTIEQMYGDRFSSTI